MNEYLLLKFLHIVGFAYWLGGDLGVFHSSYYVANDRLSPEVRVAAAKILFWLDQVPRVCMTMMLPLGLHLAWLMNLLPLSAGGIALVWIAAFGWLGMVVVLHIARPSPGKTLLTRFDFWFRATLAAVLVATGILSLASAAWPMPYWLAAKLTIFGVLIACGLMVRLKLKDFGPAFARLAANDVDDDVNAALRRSLGGTRPYVVVIWVGLLASTALGLHLL